MGFNIEFRDKDGAVVTWPQLDKEVCELWGVKQEEHWAIPPRKCMDDNWYEFLGLAVMLTRAYKETGTFLPSDLLIGLCNYGELYPELEIIESYKYEIQLIFYWISKGYKIIVTNRW